MDTTLALVPSNLLTASTTFQKQNVLENVMTSLDIRHCFFILFFLFLIFIFPSVLTFLES